MNKKIKGEKGQEKKGRKLGGISVALDFIVCKGEPVVHQITNSEKCPDNFLEMWLRNKTMMTLPH